MNSVNIGKPSVKLVNANEAMMPLPSIVNTSQKIVKALVNILVEIDSSKSNNEYSRLNLIHLNDCHEILSVLPNFRPSFCFARNCRTAGIPEHPVLLLLPLHHCCCSAIPSALLHLNQNNNVIEWSKINEGQWQIENQISTLRIEEFNLINDFQCSLRLKHFFLGFCSIF